MADKKDEKAPSKSELENRLAAVEHALSAGMNVDLSAYDPAAIQEAREQALDKAAEKATAELEKALAEAKSVKLSDEERIERLERAVQSALGRSL